MRLSYKYTNRLIDISMFDTPLSGIGEVDLEFGLPAKIVTGKQKLTQKFIVLLLTAQGSVYNDSRQGTLVGDFLAGNLYPKRNLLQNYFVISIKSVRNIIIEEQDASTPDDEFLVDASLEDFSISAYGKIDCRIDIETKDGETFIVPITLGSIS